MACMTTTDGLRTWAADAPGMAGWARRAAAAVNAAMQPTMRGDYLRDGGVDVRIPANVDTLVLTYSDATTVAVAHIKRVDFGRAKGAEYQSGICLVLRRLPQDDAVYFEPVAAGSYANMVLASLNPPSLGDYTGAELVCAVGEVADDLSDVLGR